MTDTKKTGAATKKPRKTASTKTSASKAAATKSATTTASAKPARKTASKKASKETISIDGKQYPVDALNENAKAQINNIRATDKLIGELETELAITKTARHRYGEALEHELAQIDKTPQ